MSDCARSRVPEWQAMQALLGRKMVFVFSRLYVCMCACIQSGKLVSHGNREFSDLKSSHLAIFTSYLLVLYPFIFP